MKNDDYVILNENSTVLKSVKKDSEPEPLLPKRPRSGKGKGSKWKIVRRTLLCFGSTVLFLLIAVILTCNLLVNGPSESMRNMLVLSARQASATKWIPALFIGREMTEQIERDSKKIISHVIPMEGSDQPNQGEEDVDEWKNAIDGIQYIQITKPTFKAYLLIIRDPSRVFVGVSSDFHSGKTGAVIFSIAEKYQAIAAINGGEFADPGGMGTGDNPMGITFSEGEIVWNDGLTNRTFIGITKDNRMVVSEGMTKARAEALGIRDGVCFQTGNSLISNDGTNMTLHYADGDKGTAQRTAIGQRQDGAILMLVTDGRTASSIGATHNDLIDIMREYGAVVAGKLDGGSSAMMYYRDYFDLYHIDTSLLDEYQLKGLVNKYKAFTQPRRIPTYFIVGASS